MTNITISIYDVASKIIKCDENIASRDIVMSDKKLKRNYKVFYFSIFFIHYNMKVILYLYIVDVCVCVRVAKC